jgi:hypothetical protein
MTDADHRLLEAFGSVAVRARKGGKQTLIDTVKLLALPPVFRFMT